VKPELIITASALIAVFAGLYTLLVFKRRSRDAAAASPDTLPKD
jgi:hypothetical protein